ncbi:iron ABC transporter substrate-binding protein [Nocardioides sp.]|uniref:iron ABC transporter substrate-binding protein n=1 Tax=Nocardioides sp. TaxID=35761 RepID=UPI002D7E3063|nr:iron ABC transporter substrate-binding protein [Nocardioides sp.]HET8960400.1 iron ABC transporter substrate-binding protein [Nocardioides sp.]
MSKNLLVACAAAVLTAPMLTSCGDDGPFITVYNAQHEELIAEVAPIFEEETGIEVKLRSGDDLELANQLVQEGDASPADVFLTENSPAMTLVDNAGLFTEVDQETLDLIPPEYVPSDRTWVGFMGRSTVAMYNTDALSEAEMPDSILDFADPEWEGRISYSPTGADFQAIVSAVLEMEGEQATREWLSGLADNGTEYDGNDVVMESVNSGEVDAGIAYHYYWYRDQKESGEHSDNTELHFFGDQDPGAFVSVSGAGVLASSDKQSDAQEFVNFLASVEGQQAIADSYALEYPLNPEVSLDPPVKPFAELEPPRIDVATLNSEPVTELMQEEGLL